MLVRWKNGARAARLATMMAIGLVGCANDTTPANQGGSDRELGSFGLGLTLPNGVNVTSVHYEITRAATGVVTMGSIAVGSDGKASVNITGLAAATDYLVKLTSEGTVPTACSGQAAFAIVASQTTLVDVVLECADDGNDTTVVLNGKFDICPRIGTTSVTPAQVALGSSALISAIASDKDGDSLSYAWGASSGAAAPANAANTSYTCTTLGTQILTLTVTDAPGCARTTTLSLNCVSASGSDAGVPDAGSDADVANVQLLGFNDFHGNIEPPTGSSGNVFTGLTDAGAAVNVVSGGAAYFARHLANLRAQNPNTLVVSAGDLIGASPLASALFHDEPTIEAFNMMGLDINGVGNHEFDEGKTELLRMQYGGCHPVDGCVGKSSFPGASFKFLAANVLTDVPSSSTLFDRYAIRAVDGVKIAFIGMTLEGTPEIVTPSGVAGLTFRDEADTVNAIVPELQAQGVRSIVVVIHEGGFQTGLINDCVGISGAIVDIVNRLDPEVDLVLSGHTHAAYNCVINNKRVTSALSFGRLITQVKLSIDRTTQNVVAVDAQNRIVTRDVPVDPAVDALVTRYVAAVAPLRDRVIGTAGATLTRSITPVATNASTGESTLGDVIADAQLAAAVDASRPLPHVAFMNPGGVRADLAAGPITYGAAFTIQPFGNTLVTLTINGAQVDTLLEQQFTATTTRVLHPSANVFYTFDFAAPVGSRVTGITIDGVPVNPAASYRVTVNNFLSTGGDGFVVLNNGTDRVGGDVDIDAFANYLSKPANNPVLPPPQTRILRTN